MSKYVYRESDKHAKREARAIIRHKINEILMSNFCQRCKIENPKHPEIYDFDHQHDKIECFSNMISQSRNWDKIWIEIKKCLILCANCHRIKTQKDIQNNVKIPTTPSPQMEIFQ